MSIVGRLRFGDKRGSRSGATRKLAQRDRVVFSPIWLTRALLLSSLVLTIGLSVIAVQKIRAVPIGDVIITGYSGSETADSGATLVELNALIGDELKAGFWSLDLTELRNHLEQHSWVRQAVIRRQWPNHLLIGIDEHVAVARWNNTSLLSASGTLFAPGQLDVFEHLPLFHVSKAEQHNGHVVRQLVQQFNELQKPLMTRDLSIRELARVRGQHLWFVLNNGVRVELGATNTEKRFVRFLVLLDSALQGKLIEVDTVDLRYPNGVSVKWRELDGDINLAFANYSLIDDRS